MPNLKPLISTFLASLHTIHDSGKATDERSYYPALAALFDSVGRELSPRVVALHDVADRGIGHPDFLLQVETTKDIRAAVEVKGSTPELDSISNSEQVRRYLTHHDPILVTNLREFALVRMGRHKQPEVIMRHTFAGSEAAFWLASPTTVANQLANQQAERFGDFLIAAMTWDAEIKRPVDLANALARYARETLRRLESQPAEALAGLRRALADALGLEFSGANGEHFFRSSLVQTLFYGLFSAWVACNQRGGCEDFRWREAGDYLGLPLLRELFERVAIPSQLESLDIRKPLEWAEATLNRTAWDDFSRVFNEADAVNYFYEPFLEAFDPELRRDLGVWYTPREIVRYMVARVDTVLREELGIADGLADPNVYVLDPCCGTGAYVLEVLRQIAHTLEDKGEGALLAAELKKAASSRVFGFEILPAPFVVAQLQIGLLLTQLGAPLSGNHRAGIYLTNALTGWEDGPVQHVLDGFPELKKEAEAATHVKRATPILVILGNPPYSGFAGTAIKEERALTEAYRQTIRAPRPQGQGLNDLYVRFFRMAERRIVEKTGKGIVSFISNYSWLDGLSHTGMRERYLEAFDQIYIDNLNGDKYRTGKVTPEGQSDPSVFSTSINPEGIQVGTAITTMVRRDEHQGANAIQFRNLWGRTKLAQLGDLATSTSLPYVEITPAVEIGYPFAVGVVGVDYFSWPKLTELFPTSFPGVMTARDSFLVDIDPERLEKRLEQYFDQNLSHEQMRQIAPNVMRNTAGFNAENVRNILRKRGLMPNNIVRYCYRPFDTRWLYWEPETNLLDRNRAEYLPHVFKGNVWLFTTGRTRKDWIEPPFVTTTLVDFNFMDSGARGIPLYLKPKDAMLSETFGNAVNITHKATVYITAMNIKADDLFYHAIAMMHALAYRVENAGALRQDWPRIPLHDNRERLKASADLGRQIAALLDTEKPVPGVTSGKLRDELKTIGAPDRVGGGQLNPDTDFKVQARWGYAGRGGITMPGVGTVIERDITAGEFDGLGTRTMDVYLNEAAYWRNIPLPVWEYTIGGYQVIKKWLSYREFALLGRSLTLDEVREVQNMARRIAAILLLEPALDANYAAVKAAVVKV